MEQEYLHIKLEEIIKRLEKVEALNKEQQVIITKLTRDLDEVVQTNSNLESRLDEEGEVTKMNPWKPKYPLDQK